MIPEEAIEIIHEKHMDMEFYFAEHDRYPKYYDFEFDQATLIAAQALKEVQQYRAIGTVEECREAVEKQKPKAVTNGKLIKNFYGSPYCIKGDCPTCGRESIKSTDTDYCYVCGQHLKYDENLEGMEDGA